ncbi:oxygenase MpaB family protein [Paractinoplanes globisporus]|uniref:Oxygenase MpaB family protein n=1 Tax=Paractinoplanes globisporus TaxID=113565 RepID=A0ABW6W6H5_9ACTN|nr:oxygenase MpaB family protein [Actinoplanes globisporus]
MEDGLFDDAAVIRRVAREGLMLAGGGRATLLQIAHPGVARGVHDHSDFAGRPLDRLRKTMIYVYGVLFGTRDEARAISQAVAAMHRRVTGPGYRADDPELQVWVNATLYDTAMVLYQRVVGPLPTADADVCYQQYSVLATSIGCPGSAWPADRAAFTSYWEEMVVNLRVGAEARVIGNALMWPRNLPVALRPGVPLNRFVTIGLLPAPIREGYHFRWSRRRERLLDGGLSAASVVYPHLPHVLRDAAKDYYLNDLRRRFARRRTPIAADG